MLTEKYCNSTFGRIAEGGDDKCSRGSPGMARRTSSLTNISEHIFTMEDIFRRTSASPAEDLKPRTHREFRRQRSSMISPLKKLGAVCFNGMATVLLGTSTSS